MMDAAKTGQFIADLRKSRGFTQQDVADRLGITDKTVSKWECGNGYPDITIIPALAELFQVTADELLLGERIVKEESRPVGAESRKKQVGYLLRTKRQEINHLLIGSIGCGIAAVVLLFSLGRSTFSAPISCGASVLLCVIGMIIAMIALSKARFVTEDRELTNGFPSEISAFCDSIVLHMRVALLIATYPLTLSCILSARAARLGGMLTVFDLTNPLFSLAATVAAIIVFIVSNKPLHKILKN